MSTPGEPERRSVEKSLDAARRSACATVWSVKLFLRRSCAFRPNRLLTGRPRPAHLTEPRPLGSGCAYSKHLTNLFLRGALMHKVFPNMGFCFDGGTDPLVPAQGAPRRPRPTCSAD